MSEGLAIGAAVVLALLGASRRGSRQELRREEVDVDAFSEGYRRGRAAAQWTDWPEEAREGAEPQAAYESLVGHAWEAQSISRSCSPWEFTAAQFQRRADPERARESYEQGVAAGIDAGARERLGMDVAPIPEVLKPPEPPPPPKQLPSVVPQARRFLRTGFPWPEGTPLYHGTYAMQAIARQGFRTRSAGAPQMMGGRHVRSVSTTLEPRRAAAIALYLDTLGRGSRREFGCSGLFYRLRLEAPRAAEQALLSLFTSAAAYGPRSGVLGHLQSILSALDEGWTYAEAPVRGKESWLRDLPKGARRVGGGGYAAVLLPPGSGLGMGCGRVFPHLLKETVQYGGGEREAFNPIIYGADDLSKLEDVPPWSYGVVELTAQIPRVCTDFRGAVRLGYLPRFRGWRRGALSDPLEYEARVLSDRMQTWYLDCETALEGPRSEYEAQRVRRPLNSPGLWGMPVHDVNGWVVTQRGERTPRTTMLYYDGEEEVRAYDPSALRVRRFWSIADLRRRFRLGERLTFPWFQPHKADVRVWPPGVRGRGREEG